VFLDSNILNEQWWWFLCLASTMSICHHSKLSIRIGLVRVFFFFFYFSKAWWAELNSLLGSEHHYTSRFAWSLARTGAVIRKHSKSIVAGMVLVVLTCFWFKIMELSFAGWVVRYVSCSNLTLIITGMIKSTDSILFLIIAKQVHCHCYIVLFCSIGKVTVMIYLLFLILC
jgi:hypothetical protein